MACTCMASLFDISFEPGGHSLHDWLRVEKGSF